MRHAFCTVGSATPNSLGDLELLCKFRRKKEILQSIASYCNQDFGDNPESSSLMGRVTKYRRPLAFHLGKPLGPEKTSQLMGPHASGSFPGFGSHNVCDAIISGSAVLVECILPNDLIYWSSGRGL